MKNKERLASKIILGSFGLALSSEEEVSSSVSNEDFAKMGISLKPPMDFIEDTLLTLRNGGVPEAIEPSDSAFETHNLTTASSSSPINELLDNVDRRAVIKVIGIGGGGGNAVDHMFESGIREVEFISVNTDRQALQISKCSTIVQIGVNLTKGLGAGADPEIGRQAAMEDRERIAAVLDGADMVFITAGMGGGTGTGAATVVADIAREIGALTVAVVTRPFKFEGEQRKRFADQGLKILRESVDSLITIPNDKLLEVLGKEASLKEAFALTNDVLRNAVQGISELITHPGLVNVDFADVKTVMSEMGAAMMSSSTAAGATRAGEAMRGALSCPLLEDSNLLGARGVLLNLTAGPDLSIGEIEEIGNMVHDLVCEDATVVIGTSICPEMKNSLRVTIVVTGIEETNQNMRKPAQLSLVHAATVAVGNNYEPLEVNLLTEGPLSCQVPFDMDEEQRLEIPAFLRRQAD